MLVVVLLLSTEGKHEKNRRMYSQHKHYIFNCLNFTRLPWRADFLSTHNGTLISKQKKVKGDYLKNPVVKKSYLEISDVISWRLKIGGTYEKKN